MACALVCVAYVAVYFYRTNSRNHRVNVVSNLKQVGLGSRLNKNDCCASFVFTGRAVPTNTREKR